MNIKVDLRNRAPAILRLPDQRLRITREYDILPSNPSVVSTADLLAWVWQDWGTADEHLSQCLLVKQDIPAGQNGFPFEQPNKEPPRLIRVYEEISNPAEQQVGNTDIAIDQDKIVTAKNVFLQFSSATPTFGRIGSDSISLSSIYAGTTVIAILRSDSRTDDGTLRTITREYISQGEIARDEQTKNNGALTIKTVTAVNHIPAVFDAGTSSWTIIDKKTEHPAGVPVYTYSFANGVGEIDRDTQSKNNNALQIVTIRQLTIPGTSTQPTSDPLSGGIIIDTQKNQQDGYMLWSVTWAKGSGEISRDIEYRNSVNQGVVGLTIVTVKYLSASSVGTNPITSPGAGYVLVRDEHEDADGYRIWTAVYGLGQGTIISADETRENGKLKVYNRVALGTPPSAPASTIGGVVVITKAESKRDRFHEATIVYDYQFAEGIGEVAREYTQHSAGAVDFDAANPDAVSPAIVRCSIRYLTAGTTTIDPTSKPTSNFYRVGSGFTEGEGYRIWNSTYAYGNGVVSIERVPREGGILEYRQTVLDKTSTPATWRPITGAILVKRNLVEEDGIVRMDLTWMLRSDQAAIPVGTSVLTYGIKHPFTFPGRAKIYSVNIPCKDGNGTAFTATAYDVFKSPALTQEVDATADIQYQKTNLVGSLPYTLWNPSDWATVRASWEGWNVRPRSEVFPLPGYIIAGTTATFFAGTTLAPASGFTTSILGERVYGGSQASIAITCNTSTPEGQTLVIGRPDLEPVFYDIENNQQWYRRTVVYATLPTLPALPV